MRRAFVTIWIGGVGGVGMAAGAAHAQMDQPTSGSQPSPSGATVPTTGSGAPVGPGAAPGGAAPPSGMGFMWIVMLMLLVMIGMSVLTGRKEKKKRTEMMASLKRKDVVQTSAGIIGTVEELGDHEVTLRVDEASNTRIKFNKAAIQAVLKSGKPANGAAEVKPAQPATVS